MWVLFQLLSTQQRLGDNNFEYRLILEYNDNSKISVIDIDINAVKVKHKSWLHLVRKEALFCNIVDVNIPYKDNLPLRISCFIDVSALLKVEPRLKYIYLWASTLTSNEKISLETVCFEAIHSLRKLNEEIEYRDFNKIFVQMYPKVPSKKYDDLEYERLDSEGLLELLPRIQEQPKKVIATEKSISIEQMIAKIEPIVAEASITEAEANQDCSDLEMVDKKDADLAWGIFSKQDLDNLIEGFNDWQRVHGKNTLIARLPKVLADKIGGEFKIAFWTSGQGISNMVLDDRPPRHTMVLGIINTSIEGNISNGIAYCIQRPTSLDKIWMHQQWHRVECSDSEIVKVAPVSF